MASYETGYGKPPLSGRFRPGASGNPKGRPKRNPTPLAERIKTVLNAPIEYRERGRTKFATYRELSLKMLVDRAISGDLAAARRLQRRLGWLRALSRQRWRRYCGRRDWRCDWGHGRLCIDAAWSLLWRPGPLCPMGL